MAYRFGTTVINDTEVAGRRLYGPRHGEHVRMPADGEQGASELFLFEEKSLEDLVNRTLGKIEAENNGNSFRISAHRHPHFTELVAVDLTLTPYVPLKGDRMASGHPIDPKYAYWKAEIQYGEDVGWVDRWKGSLKVAAVEVNVAAAGSSPTYNDKVPYPFPEGNLSVTNKRVPKFDPVAYLGLFGKINANTFDLPSGTEVTSECCQYLTYDAVFHKRPYGPNFWTVTHEFLVQPFSWNKTPARADGTLANLTRGDKSTPLFETFNSTDFPFITDN